MSPPQRPWQVSPGSFRSPPNPSAAGHRRPEVSVRFAAGLARAALSALYREPVADIDRSRTIAADPQSVWDVLADFGSISSWADNIDHSCILNHGDEPTGTTRRVQIRRNALVETITDFDTPHALTYQVDGLPKRVRR